MTWLVVYPNLFSYDPHFVSVRWSEPAKIKMEVGDICYHELRNVGAHTQTYTRSRVVFCDHYAWFRRQTALKPLLMMLTLEFKPNKQRLNTH